jgi:hypothetical protein
MNLEEEIKKRRSKKKTYLKQVGDSLRKTFRAGGQS